MEEELWKDIAGYELYQVSNLGRVRSLRRMVSGRYDNMQVKAGRVLKCHVSASGYVTVCINHKGKKSLAIIHRLVAEAFVPNPDNKPCVNHKNGVKTYNRPENLEWCTHSENTCHAYSNGLLKAVEGDKHWNRKLSATDIPRIRELLSSGETRTKIAALYSVTTICIRDIHNRKTWKSV